MIFSNVDDDGRLIVLSDEMPSTVRGTVTPNDDGSHTIFLNARLSSEQNVLSYQHEIDHIENDDFILDSAAEAEAV